MNHISYKLVFPFLMLQLYLLFTIAFMQNIVKTKQTQLVKTLFTNIVNKGELSGNI